MTTPDNLQATAEFMDHRPNSIHSYTATGNIAGFRPGAKTRVKNEIRKLVIRKPRVRPNEALPFSLFMDAQKIKSTAIIKNIDLHLTCYQAGFDVDHTFG